MAEVFIALGSNMGDRAANLRDAQAAMATDVAIRERSSIHETKPEYVTDQPPFLNMVVRACTTLEPVPLLDFLKKIERNLGRKPSRRFGPRAIDLDILYFGDRLFHEKRLVLPHPRIAERVFVLLPLSEIAPHLAHPVTGRTTIEMLDALRLGSIHGAPNCRD